MPTSTSRRVSVSPAKDGKPSGVIKPAANDAAAEPADCDAKVSFKRNGKTSWFTSFAQKTAHLAGKPITFLLAAATIVVWAVTGPLFGYSDTWQLVINTTTTIITFLMVFLIQNTQNQDTQAMQIKLDELIRATQGAHNALLALEELDGKDLERFRKRYAKLALDARRKIAAGELDIDSPEVKAEHDS